MIDINSENLIKNLYVCKIRTGEIPALASIFGIIFVSVSAPKKKKKKKQMALPNAELRMHVLQYAAAMATSFIPLYLSEYCIIDFLSISRKISLLQLSQRSTLN
jgi:hypothetical protein